MVAGSGEPADGGPALGDDVLSAALSSIANAVFVTDRSGVIRWVNAAFTRMSGYPAEEAIGSTPRLLKSGVQEARVYDDLWSTVLSGRTWSGELVNRHRAGHLYTVRQTITPVVDGAGEVSHFVAVHEDVTELRDSQARLRALFDQAADAVVFFDDDGRCLDANPAACALAGRDVRELAAVPVEELLPDEDWAQLWPAVRTGEQHKGRCRVRRPDGELRDVEVEVVPEVMPGVHVATCRDVTERRRAEAERDLQAQLVEAAGAAVVATDLQGRVTFWNGAAEELYGWSRDEVLGRNILAVGVAPALGGRASEILDRVRAGTAWTSEFEVARRDGTTFPALITNAPHVDETGEVTGIIGVSTDVTELRVARWRAQQRAAQQAAVAGLGRRALAELDLDALFDEAAKVVAAELDVPLVKILETTDDAERLVVRAGVGWQQGVVGAATVPNDAGSMPGYTLAQQDAVLVEDLAAETRFAGPDLLTDHGVVAGLATTIRGRHGIRGVLAAHTTGPRRFSHDDVVFLDAVAALLGGAIVRDEIEAELQATVDRLARSEEIRLAFLRATSHELRTPLTALAGFAQTLEGHDHELEPDQRAHLLDRLHANATRLSRLIEDLLDVDRLASGLVTARRVPHDVRELVRRVVDELDPAGRRLDLRLEPVEAEVDPAKLERVVANLVANAVRHTPGGAAIHVGLTRRDDVVVLTVEDDGAGIDPDYLDQIFEPFVQGPEQHDDPQPGTGIGLALAREFVRLHGGRITAANRPEGGTRFEVVLPAAVDDPEGVAG